MSKNKGDEIESTIYDFYQLLKPRVMSLVVFTGIVGIILAPGDINIFIAMIATLCIAIGSGAAGAINMWYEKDIDSIMQRTKKRPLPMGKILPEHALEFGIIMAVISVILLFVATNFMAAFLLLVAILFYVFIYTIWLKRRTPQNIVIGGAAGSFPPMIGWAAVTGNISVESIILFLIIFSWTPPHFWSLSLIKNSDYTKAKIPMLPVVSGIEVTLKHIFAYSFILVFVSFIPFAINMSGLIYTIGSVILGGLFIEKSYNLMKNYNEEKSLDLFKYSLIYLFLLFFILIIDNYINI